MSYWYLGATKIEIGNIEDGLRAVSRATELGYIFSEPDTLRLINLYIKAGDLNKISVLFERLIAIKPSNPQYQASLAAAYAKIGKIDKAVEQARVTAQLDKTFEAEAKRFVESLGRKF